MKKALSPLLVFCVFILLFGILLLLLPSKTSDEELREKAIEIYNEAKASGVQFSSQCLGSIVVTEGIPFFKWFSKNVTEYVVDIVHAPRDDEDNLLENQCEDYRAGKVKHFIELDKDGKIVRVV